MHPDGGMTWVGECTKDLFRGEAGFAGRHDVIFFGTCTERKAMTLRENPEGIWTEDQRVVDQGDEGQSDREDFGLCLAATANLSPESETMFVTLCYSDSAVSYLWKQVHEAASTLANNTTRI